MSTVFFNTSKTFKLHHTLSKVINCSLSVTQESPFIYWLNSFFLISFGLNIQRKRYFTIIQYKKNRKGNINIMSIGISSYAEQKMTIKWKQTNKAIKFKRIINSKWIHLNSYVSKIISKFMGFTMITNKKDYLHKKDKYSDWN